MRKEITKENYRKIVWFTLFGSLILMSILSWMFTSSGVTGNQSQLGLWLSGSTIIVGFSMGLAYARSWKIKGVD